MTDLKACPFCGGQAEMYSMRGYRPLAGGPIGNEVAIYCLSCSADMSFCHEDFDGSHEDLIYWIVEQWNTRQSDERIAELERALKPFADAYYNDNGDVTLSTGHITSKDYRHAAATLKGEGE